MPINDAGKFVGTNDKSIFYLAGFDEVICGCNGKNEARTNCLDIESKGSFRADFCLNGCGGSGEGEVCVVVATIIISISSAFKPELAIAFFAAAVARSEVNSPSAAM